MGMYNYFVLITSYLVTLRYRFLGCLNEFVCLWWCSRGYTELQTWNSAQACNHSFRRFVSDCETKRLWLVCQRHCVQNDICDQVNVSLCFFCCVCFPQHLYILTYLYLYLNNINTRMY